MLYKIGDFSKLINTSIRTLRYYDNIDLFKPLEIDLYTGYRYYSDEQIEDFNKIKNLQEVGFSLEEIKLNWNNFNNDLYVKKKAGLLKEIEHVKNKIRKIDFMRSNLQQENNKIKKLF